MIKCIIYYEDGERKVREFKVKNKDECRPEIAKFVKSVDYKGRYYRKEK
jgi:hypothetical protein